MFRRIEGECGLPVPSPDGRWLAFRSCSRISSGIRVLSEQDGRVLELSLGTVGEFFWGPDSAGIYYFQGSDPAQLIYVPIPEGLPRLIHPDSGLEEWYWPPRFVEGP
jgi:Tol biopolymer transport system component